MFPGGGEMLLVVLAVLLLFGGKEMPRIARTLGHWTAVFRKSMNEVRREFNRISIEEELKDASKSMDDARRSYMESLEKDREEALKARGVHKPVNRSVEELPDSNSQVELNLDPDATKKEAVPSQVGGEVHGTEVRKAMPPSPSTRANAPSGHTTPEDMRPSTPTQEPETSGDMTPGTPEIKKPEGRVARDPQADKDAESTKPTSPDGEPSRD